MALAFPLELTTPRLVLRPFSQDDVQSVVAIQSNWKVTRNLRLATWPPTEESISAWLAGHEGEWRDGTAHRFALQLEGRVIGCCDLDGIDDGLGFLGYWLGQPHWGKGLATEAGRAVVDLARTTLGLTTLETGHVDDNPASGGVLRKLGFREVGRTKLWSKPREEEITQVQYRAKLAGND